MMNSFQMDTKNKKLSRMRLNMYLLNTARIQYHSFRAFQKNSFQVGNSDILGNLVPNMSQVHMVHIRPQNLHLDLRNMFLKDTFDTLFLICIYRLNISLNMLNLLL